MILGRKLVQKANSKRLVKSMSNDCSNIMTLKAWPKKVYESNGDYRNETFLEDHIGGPLYEKQKSLPSLPVPDIASTLRKFLPTALPLAETEQEKRDLIAKVKEFESSPFAATLQDRLLARKKEFEGSSWLQKWWNQLGYLQVRDPVVINVSYFFHLSDDATLMPEIAVEKNMSMGVLRAAAALVAIAEFRLLVCSGTIPHEALGRNEPRTPLCSAAFKYMFHGCRVPHKKQDSYKIFDPKEYTHCIIARKGQFFKVDFVNPETHRPLPLEILEQRLQECVRLADDSTASNTALPLGILTSDNRDNWAEAREYLIGEDFGFEKALETLESGAVLICLDDEEPWSKRQCGELFWHGGERSGFNRWFDKSIQIFCTDNGRLGLMGEHSMMDGMPVIGLADHISYTSYITAGQRSASTKVPSPDDGSGVKNIFEKFTQLLSKPETLAFVNKSEKAFKSLIQNHSLHVQSFQGYGSSYIKEIGHSPDAYVQQAIQLAIYRLFGKQAATYEASQVRFFTHGRTETTRSVSPASSAFIKRMGTHPLGDEGDANARKEKLQLLKTAVNEHVTYMRQAAKGAGVDRHLLGLSLCVHNGEEPPKLFNDPLFVRSKTWRVSTSHLNHPRFENWGFGEVVPNGVGVGYAVKNDSCIFNLTSRLENEWSEPLCELLEEALLEMRTLHDLEFMRSKL